MFSERVLRWLQGLKDVMGFNMAALANLQRTLKESSDTFDEEPQSLVPRKRILV